MKKTKILALLMSMAMLSSAAMPGTLAIESAADGSVEYECGMTEHTHGEDCYEDNLVCGLNETEGHKHEKECYTVETVLNCDLTEEPHECTDECYKQITAEKTSCGEESEEHEHNDGCYAVEEVQVCEPVPHEHGDDCYITNEKLTCELEETEGHAHDVECYSEPVLNCGYEENHIHTDVCYPVEELEIILCTECGEEICSCLCECGLPLNHEQGCQIFDAEACGLCGVPACDGEHEICDICEAYDCNVAHYFCDICEEYDCGNGHNYCEICEEYDDCIGIHYYCDFCKDFDCGIDHITFESSSSPLMMFSSRNPTLNQLTENVTYPVKHNDIETSKSVLYDPVAETYKLLLESYVTGSTLTSTITEGSPADVLLIVDESGSMHQCFYGDGWADVNEGCANQWIPYTDLDTAVDFYYYTKTSNKAYYCSNCRAWFNKVHAPSDGTCSSKGTWYSPKMPSEVVYVKDFHEAHEHNNSCANNCRIQLDAAVYYEYEENLDISKVYYAVNNTGALTTGKTTDNERHWCDTCEGWYGVNDSGVVQCRCVNPNAQRTIPRKWSDATLTAGYFTVEHVARHTAVSRAINAFVDKLKKDALSYNIDHRVGLVSFGSSAELLTWNNPEGTMKRVAYRDAITEAYAGDSMLSLRDNGERAILEAAVASLDRHTGDGTDTPRGMDVGLAVLEHDQTNDQRNKIVILYCDGFVAGVIADAYGMKTEFGATVYSVAARLDVDATLPDPIPAETTFWNSLNGTEKAFHVISSNYPEAQNLNNRGSLNPNLVPGEQGYFLTPLTIEELDKVFDKIYHDVQTGGANVTTLDETTVTKDVVSDDFVIGDGAVNFWTESYIAEDTWEKDTTIDSGIQRDPETENNVVSITGFDYSENYVGVDTAADGTETYHGKKLVIEIPIKPADGNNGGVAMDTNVPVDSGIFLDGEVQEHFDQPKVDIPTDVTISKTIVGGSQTSFDFDLNYSAFDSYENNDRTSGNYLTALPFNEENSEVISTETSKILQKVLVGTNLVLTEKNVADYKVEYSTDGGLTWIEIEKTGNDATATVEVIPDMTIQVRNTLLNADLTITKQLAVDDYDEHQTFIFKVTCEEDSAFQMTVVINADDVKKNDGEFSVLITDLPLRTYIVEEDGNWSGRYDATTITDSDTTTSTENGSSDGKVTLSNSTDNFVEFTNTREKTQWLDGNTYAQNIYGEIIPKPEDDGN